jgi:hypothetical protein
VVRQGIVAVVAMVVAGGVFGGCARQPTTSEASVTSPAPSSRTAADARGSSSPVAVKPSARTIMITVRGGVAGGETGRVTVPRGTPVSLAVASDAADEVHVHGYDRKAEIPAGGTATVSFTANIAGVFEVELEDSKLPLLQLRVS